MIEWWTYAPSDFLMFSPRIYWRLFGSINDAWWPLQLVLIGAPLAWIAARTQRRFAWAERIVVPAVFLAGCWSLVAWAFLHQRFAPINWIADAYATAFAVAALGLLALAAAGKLRSDAVGARSRIAIGLGLWALLVHPLLSVFAGRPWQQAEVFGLAPDPTAIATLGFLLLAEPGRGGARWLRWLQWTIAVAWCLISAATLATMESAQAVVPLLAVVLALIALCAKD
jgi:uncharacterized protein DUF6064